MQLELRDSLGRRSALRQKTRSERSLIQGRTSSWHTTRAVLGPDNTDLSDALHRVAISGTMVNGLLTASASALANQVLKRVVASGLSTEVCRAFQLASADELQVGADAVPPSMRVIARLQSCRLHCHVNWSCMAGLSMRP